MNPVPPSSAPGKQRPWMMMSAVSLASLSGVLAVVCALLSPGRVVVVIAAGAVVVTVGAVGGIWRLQRCLEATTHTAGVQERRLAAVLAEREEQNVRIQQWTTGVLDSVTWLLCSRLPAAWAGKKVPEASWPDDSFRQLFEVPFEEAVAAAQAAPGRWAHEEESQRLVVVAVAQRAQTSALRVAAAVEQFAEGHRDPEVLTILTGVSHEAAQQARHAQALQVLCGEQPGRRWQEPLALVDVVQAARGRITSYQRVQVTGDMELAVDAPVVEPLILVIAELLANGTQSSPPNTKVQVHVSAVQRGVAVRVDDGGVGMTEHELAKARVIASGERLVGLGQVGEVPQIGLPVVGTLARSLGLTVSMQDSPYGGIQVVVLIPNERVRRLQLTGMQPADSGPPRPVGHTTKEGLPIRQRNFAAPAARGAEPAPLPPANPDPARTGAVLDGLIRHTRALSVDSGTQVGDDDGR